MDWLNYQFSKDEVTKLQLHRDEQLEARLKVRFIALLLLAEKVDINMIQRAQSIATLIYESVYLVPFW